MLPERNCPPASYAARHAARRFRWSTSGQSRTVGSVAGSLHDAIPKRPRAGNKTVTDSEQDDFGARREPARPGASEMHFLRQLARRLPARSNLQPAAKSFLDTQTLDP